MGEFGDGGASEAEVKTRWVLAREWVLRWFFPRKNYEIARRVYVRGLGVIYLVAIVSWWTQFQGLVGEDGIQPVGRFFEFVEGRLGGGWKAYRQVPTLLWFGSGIDAWMHGICALGVVASLLVIAGVLTGPLLLLLWVIYLSMVTTGGVFMNFQWDILLLEAGFLAWLLAPWRLYFSREVAVGSRWVVFLYWWLLFRLMFFSGYVKLASGDLSWESCRALQFHYETQPIPNWIAWHAHQFPEWLQVWSCRGMFGIELVLPFFIFLGRWPRAIAFVSFVGLMGLIILTGNYTFFNYLTILIAVLLLDDEWWPRSWRRNKESGIESEGNEGGLGEDRRAAAKLSSRVVPWSCSLRSD